MKKPYKETLSKENRQTLRSTLLALGFTREGYTNDNGDGRYQELWSNGMDDLEIKWNANKPYPQRVIPEHDCSFCSQADAGFWFCPTCGQHEPEDAPEHEE